MSLWRWTYCMCSSKWWPTEPIQMQRKCQLHTISSLQWGLGIQRMSGRMMYGTKLSFPGESISSSLPSPSHAEPIKKMRTGHPLQYYTEIFQINWPWSLVYLHGNVLPALDNVNCHGNMGDRSIRNCYKKSNHFCYRNWNVDVPFSYLPNDFTCTDTVGVKCSGVSRSHCSLFKWHSH